MISTKNSFHLDIERMYRFEAQRVSLDRARERKVKSILEEYRVAVEKAGAKAQNAIETANRRHTEVLIKSLGVNAQSKTDDARTEGIAPPPGDDTVPQEARPAEQTALESLFEFIARSK